MSGNGQWLLGGDLQRDSLKLHQCRKACWQREAVVSLGVLGFHAPAWTGMAPHFGSAAGI